MDLLSLFHRFLEQKTKDKKPQEGVTMNNVNNFKSSATTERFQHKKTHSQDYYKDITI